MGNDTNDRLEQVDKLIKNHTYGSVAIGLIPMPLVDFVALTGVQLNMLRKMCKTYDISFSKDKGKNILASLLGGVIPTSLSGTLASMLKVVPLIGQTTGALSMAILAGASTYAVGKVFVQHFESGGTFLDFDPAKVKDYFAEQFQEGQKIAKQGAAQKTV